MQYWRIVNYSPLAVACKKRKHWTCNHSFYATFYILNFQIFKILLFMAKQQLLSRIDLNLLFLIYFQNFLLII
ncbi:hypothetical protein mru_0261 [Methanobrevibacter ruminantium M1]|uniref:Uncharacterized protein n=1 Tax=Methanobrevibacter ruminantium (strain ATCC 35063 / DSM 1093 / JCM 13430 / OCM 146 / M1) TaxID=634498 RepID=D3DZT7_METRM|nr:hypothetical protein mru_0261 [Methanobrevibacter ruminantium M1]